MREIVLDTETTGVDPGAGHRVVEIGCVELVHGIRTGQIFHSYLNPERDVPDEAYHIHGLSLEFLIDKPIFAEKVEEFLAFIGDDKLVIHNAGFDMKFINAELERVGFPKIDMRRAVDTLIMARRKFPGAPATLDALCKRFEIDLSERNKHGALLDAELLADVYIELLGGKQSALALESARGQEEQTGSISLHTVTVRASRPFPLGEEELQAHARMLAMLKKPLWTT